MADLSPARISRAAVWILATLLAGCSSSPGDAPAGPGADKAAAPSAPQAQAQAPEGTAPGAQDPAWYPWYEWALEIDGRPSAEALFFRERNGRRLIVAAPGLEKVILLNTAGQQVYPLDRAAVTIGAEGDKADLAPEAEKGMAGTTYTTAGAEVVFFVGTNRLKITPKQPLEGQASRDEILAHTPLYAKGVREYTPDPSAISYLRSIREPVEIEVFFGTWCPHCKILVPKFMKAIDVAANPSLRVRYIGVPRQFGAYGPANARGVKGIPTFIFARSGKEFGRIPGEPANGTIEHAMAEILKSLPL